MASPFQVNSNALFLCGTAEGAIAVVDTVTDLNSAACPSDQWSIVAAAATETSTITSTISPNVHNALEIFGAVIEGDKLNNLREELFDSRILVNRDGYQVKYVDNHNTQNASTAGLVKLNDVFGWARYGVKRPAETEASAVPTVWNRYAVAGGEVVVDYMAEEARQKEMAARLEKQGRDLEDSKKLVREKEGEIERFRKALEEKNRATKEHIKIIREKEGEIDRLKSALEEKNGKIKEYNGVVTEKEGKIEGQSRVITEKEGKINWLNRVIEEQMRVVMENEGEMNRLSRVTEEQSRVIMENKCEVSRLSRANEGNRRVIREKEAEIERVRREKDMEIENLKWRKEQEKKRMADENSRVVGQKEARIEEQKRVMKDKDMEIERLKLMLQKMEQDKKKNDDMVKKAEEGSVGSKKKNDFNAAGFVYELF
ncbi:unnamed protein product [Linum trigynum]|uniref:Uncharacterized protein n=1 Tax=Linum trigynum TaxID=586398 RepID=A0AAV2FNV9_9ROSI